ncbi:MAG TPA: glycosyltransferase family 2 protein [Kofleriaceae bacterium]|nr:glycosyltransferase family 2 protein [Kofleriaceae bacterium]
MRISIVTPSYNHAQFLERTIESVVSQRGDFELEYRVVDGGSTDGTRAILERYAEHLTFTSERDGGQVDAINKGLRAATGDIVGWLNSDDVLLPGALDRVARAFAANPGVEWVHGRCKIIDEHDREVRRWISAYKHYRSQHHSFENFLTEDYVSQMTTFWRRSAHDAIGYLDPSIRFAFDHDFFLRLAQRSAPHYVDEPLACFRWYETSKSGGGYEVQMRETAALAGRYGGGPWTRARARMKMEAVVGIYRLMGYARQALRR